MAAVANALAERLRGRAAKLGVRPVGEWVWPSAEYQTDPVRFGRVELGIDVAQVDGELAIVESVRDNRRTAVSGGRKVGKDFALGLLAIWFYCSFPGARVRFTAVTGQQLRDIFWREIRMLLAHAGRCVDCKRKDPNGPKPCPHAHPIPEEPATLPETGLRSPDFREIIGVQASSEEAAAGISGAYQLNIVDEASDVDEFVFEAIDGNLGGCIVGRVVYISNPTRNVGRFYDAFHERSKAFNTIYLSSRETLNVRAGKLVIPGLATREWVQEMEEIYGKDSQWVTIHVDGQFVTNPEGTVFTLEAIDKSFAACDKAADDDGDELQIGLDIAGAGDGSDESGFAARRGRKMLECYALRGLDPDSGAHVVHALGLIAKHRRRNDKIRVVVDREGEQGAKAWRKFGEYLAQKDHEDEFHLIGVRASERAQRQQQVYERTRDELIASLASWMRDGGALPADARLRGELNAFRWVPQVSGRSRLMSKDDMRKILGRSPDRADACSLACWGPMFIAATTETQEGNAADDAWEKAYGGTFREGGSMDVYGSTDWARR